MTTKSSPNKRKLSVSVIVAIIGLIGICITTIGGIVIAIIPNLSLPFFSNKENTVAFRVADSISGESVSQAKVVLLSGNDSYTDYSDDNGFVSFSVKEGGDLRVIVETLDYEIYDQVISSITSKSIQLMLKPVDADNKSIIIRILDSKTNSPIIGANVVLIINTEVYPDITDSNGITKFTADFQENTIDGDITVSFDGYKIENQKVTLVANSIQNINLDKDTGGLSVSPIGTQTSNEGAVNLPLPTPSPEVTSQVIFENGEFRNTTSNDFTFRVAKVELNPNGKMRWYFEFWNKSDKAVLYGLNYSNTVLADEFGNQYTVQDASTYPNNSFEKSVAAGVRENLWIDFDAPINNAKKFTLTLTPANPYWHPHYGLLEIIVIYDISATPPVPEPTISLGSSVVFENGEFQATTSSNFNYRVSRVDLLQNGRMRWYFEFWNQSDEAVLFGLNYSNITLADENGHQYSVVDASNFPNKSFEKNIPAGVLFSLWIEFDAPVNNSKIFKVTLVPANPYWHPHYDVFNVTLN